MRMKFSFVLIIPILFLLNACTQSAAPVMHYGVKEGAGSAGVHIVASGDTLWTVSNRYKIVMRDIALANDLSAPFILEPRQRLRLPPPREYRVRPGDRVTNIAKLFGVSASELVKLNRLSAPYTVRPGQVLRIPSVTRKTPRPAIQQVQAQPSVVQDGVSTPARVPDVDAGTALPAPVSRGSENVVPARKPSVSQAQVQKPARKPESRAVRTAKKKLSVKTPKRSSSKFLQPVEGKVISSYGPKSDGSHNDGINIRAPRGAPVLAAENGVVVYAGNGLKGSGNLILVRHDNRWMTAYAHLDRISVKNGATIKRGQSIGTVGSTGAVNSPQLHFEVRRGTEAINPKPYIE